MGLGGTMDLARLSLGKVAKIIAIIVVILIVGVAAFFVFKIRINAKTALREAKNIRVALRSADIEIRLLFVRPKISEWRFVQRILRCMAKRKLYIIHTNHMVWRMEL